LNVNSNLAAMQIKSLRYNLLLLTGIVFVLMSLFTSNKNNQNDLHLHYTYIVIAHTQFFWLLAIASLFVWMLYF